MRTLLPKMEDLSPSEIVKDRGERNAAVWYEDIIDWLVENPGGSYTDCAKALGKNPAYIGLLMKSDFLKSRLAARRAERRAAVDRALAEKAAGVASKGLDILAERFSENTDRLPTKLVVEATQNLFSMLGYSPDRVGTPPPSQVNTQVVVQVSSELLAAARERVRGVEKDQIKSATVIEGEITRND